MVRRACRASASTSAAADHRHVVAAAQRSELIDEVLVATDRDAARAEQVAGADVVMTDPALPSGSDRMAQRWLVEGMSWR